MHLDVVVRFLRREIGLSQDNTTVGTGIQRCMERHSNPRFQYSRGSRPSGIG